MQHFYIFFPSFPVLNMSENAKGNRLPRIIRRLLEEVVIVRIEIKVKEAYTGI
jgi:hypothetical protein